jgi:hypothetical protein
MAYKMAPRGGNNAKTGHGIPMTFRQDGPKQEFIKKIGETISHANKAGMTAYDNSRKPDSYWGGSGRQDTYTKNPVEYVKGFVGDIMADKPTKTTPKPKVKTTGPTQKRKTAITPKTEKTPKKEKGFLEKAGDYVSSAVDKVSEALKPGPSPDSRYGESNDTFFGVDLSGSDAFTYDPTKNPMSSQYKKKKGGPQQKMAMKNKKAPAKMKKC